MGVPTKAAVLDGRYRLDHLLGRGGMGVVWAGHDTLLDRPVAVKMLRDDVAMDVPSQRERLLAEARAAAAVHHPNLVLTLDAGYDDGALAIVMERLPGRSLAERLDEGPLSPAEARTVASDVLAGLEALHQSGLVHRDVKPANVLEASDGTWKVVDFGIAKSIHGGTDLTLTGTTIGTPAYLAPEQLTGERATPRSDVWAVGVMLYESLAGQRPFVGETPFAIADAVQTTDPPPLSAFRSDVDPVMSAAVDRALHKSPEDRFEAASDMSAALQGGETALIPLTSQMTAAPRPEPGTHGEARPAAEVDGSRSAWRRRSVVLPAAAALLVALIAAAVLANGTGGDADGSATLTGIRSLGAATAAIATRAASPTSATPGASGTPGTSAPPSTEAPDAGGSTEADDKPKDDDKDTGKGGGDGERGGDEDGSDNEDRGGGGD